MDTIKELLREEIEEEMEIMSAIGPGTKEHELAVKDLTELVDRMIEIEKTEVNFKQIEEDRKDRFIKNCLSVAGIVVPVAVTIWGTLKTFEFEKEGTITTTMGRGFINKLLLKK